MRNTHNLFERRRFKTSDKWDFIRQTKFENKPKLRALDKFVSITSTWFSQLQLTSNSSKWQNNITVEPEGLNHKPRLFRHTLLKYTIKLWVEILKKNIKNKPKKKPICFYDFSGQENSLFLELYSGRWHKRKLFLGCLLKEIVTSNLGWYLQERREIYLLITR